MRRILKKGFSKSQPILDEIDCVLAAHYGFTDEELDFIPSAQLRAGNYDIKCRMGRDAEGEEEWKFLCVRKLRRVRLGPRSYTAKVPS